MELQEKIDRFRLARVLGIKQTILQLQQFKTARQALNEAPKQLGFITPAVKKDIEIPDPSSFIVYGEESYPQMLAQCCDAPPILFYKGNLSCLQDTLKISIVGSRKYTQYGKKIAGQFAEQAVAKGVATVSGLAFGIDAIVHEKTLSAGGKTIAVIGTAIDQPSPAQHRYLYDAIIANGGIVLAETNQETGYDKWVFPKRNRIIAGLSRATLVVEAAEKSGALITADKARSYERPVFVVPGNVDSPVSQGCFYLLKEKLAEPASCLSDIFPELYSEITELIAQQQQDTIPLHRELLDLIACGPVSVSALINALPQFLTTEVFIALGQLEIVGSITKSGNGTYSLT